MFSSVWAELKPNFRKVRLLVQNKGRVWVFFKSVKFRDGGKGLQKWEPPFVCLCDWFKNLQITNPKFKNHPTLVAIEK